MSAITIEKTHALLERLAEYVMNEVVTWQETDGHFRRLERRLDKLEQEKEEGHTVNSGWYRCSDKAA